MPSRTASSKDEVTVTTDPTRCHAPPSAGRPRAAAVTIVALAALGAMAACGTAPAETLVERADSAGVEVVVNHGADQPAGWQLRQAFSLGGAEDGPEAFFNVGRGGLAGDEAGHLYVLDRGNHRVVVFDADGRYVRTLGRQGGGPGELQWPGSLSVARDGSVVIGDIGHGGLVRISATGEPLANRSLDTWRGGSLASFRDGLVTVFRDGDPDAARETLTYLNGGETRGLVSMDGVPLRPVDFGCVRISGMSQLFAPSLVWAAGAGRIATAMGAAYEIDIHDGDRHVARIRRDLAPRPATRELAIQEVGEAFEVQFGGGGSCKVEASKVVDERGVAQWIPAVRRVALGPDGTLWVQRYAVRGDPAPIDLFAADGGYLGTLPPDAPFPEAFLTDHRIVSVEKDDLDLDHVVVYDLVRAAD